jgi:hypothetical protein
MHLSFPRLNPIDEIGAPPGGNGYSRNIKNESLISQRSEKKGGARKSDEDVPIPGMPARIELTEKGAFTWRVNTKNLTNKLMWRIVMNKIKILISLGVIATLVLALMPLTAVLAAKPNKGELTVEDTHVLDPAVCSFDITIHEYGTISWMDFFDQNGNLIRSYTFYGSMKETWSANGKSLNDQISGPGQLVFTPGSPILEFSFLGTNDHLTVPGYGIASPYGGSGQRTFQYDMVTGVLTLVKSTGIYLTDPTPICNYLSP